MSGFVSQAPKLWKLQLLLFKVVNPREMTHSHWLCWHLGSVALHVFLFHLRISQYSACVFWTSWHLDKGRKGAICCLFQRRAIRNLVSLWSGLGDDLSAYFALLLTSATFFLYPSPRSLLTYFVHSKSSWVLALLDRGGWASTIRWLVPSSGNHVKLNPKAFRVLPSVLSPLKQFNSYLVLDGQSVALLDVKGDGKDTNSWRKCIAMCREIIWRGGPEMSFFLWLALGFKISFTSLLLHSHLPQVCLFLCLLSLQTWGLRLRCQNSYTYVTGSKGAVVVIFQGIMVLSCRPKLHVETSS